MYFSIFADIFYHLTDNGNRYGKGITRIGTSHGGNGRIDAYQFSADVDQGTAAVAGINCRICLDKGFNGHLSTHDTDSSGFGTHNACSNRGGEVEGITYGEHPFTQPQGFRIAPGQYRQIFGVDLDQGNIRVWIPANDFGRKLSVVIEDHLNFRRTIHNMVVGDDVSVIADDYT